MKKLLVVLLSLGLIVGLGTAVSAADLQMKGEYNMFGAYDNNGDIAGGYSRAAMWQQTRFNPTVKVADGLSFTFRFDALEKDWGDTSWKTNGLTTIDETSSRRENATNNQKTQENLEFERSHVNFNTGIGQFVLGYQGAGTWGTAFGDYAITRPRAKWQMPFGPITMIAIWEKNIEWDNRNLNPTGKVDADTDSYYLAGVYKQGKMEAGLLYGYTLGNTTRLAATPFKIKLQTLQPYMKATFGPVYVEAELDYYFGKAREYEQPTTAVPDVDKQGWGGYVNAKLNMGPAYVGAAVGYMSGDDGSDVSKDKSGSSYKDWKPAWILQNNDMPDPLPGHWANDGGAGTTSKREQMTTYNVYAGYKVTPKLEVSTSITMAKSSVKFKGGMYVGSSAGFAPGTAGVEYISDNLGTEWDVTAEYKVFDNLTYTVGAGYLWTGDFFKNTNAAQKVDNDYTILHKLNLEF